MNKQNEEKDGQIQVLEEELVICSICGHTFARTVKQCSLIKYMYINLLV